LGTVRLRHAGEVRGLAFAPDGKAVASVGGGPAAVRLWDVRTGRELRHFPAELSEGECLAFSADGKLLATGPGSGQICLWDAASGEKRWRASAVRGNSVPRVFAVAFSPDGKILATGDGLGQVLLWDVGTGKRRGALQGHKAPVQALAYSPDGTT